jgi:hypothetical protein
MEGDSVGKAPLENHTWSSPQADASFLSTERVFGSWQDRVVGETSGAGTSGGAGKSEEPFSTREQIDEDDSDGLEFIHQGAAVLNDGHDGGQFRGKVVLGQEGEHRRSGKWRTKRRLRGQHRRYEKIPHEPDGAVTRLEERQGNTVPTAACSASKAANSDQEQVKEIEALPDSTPSARPQTFAQFSSELPSAERSDSIDLERGRVEEPVLLNAAIRPRRWTWKRVFRRLFVWRGSAHAATSAGTTAGQPYDTLQMEQGLDDDGDDDTETDRHGIDAPEMLSAAIGDFLSAQHSWEIHAHRLVSQPDLSYAIAVNREALERKEQLRVEEQRQAAEQSRLRMAAMQFRSLFIRDASHDEAMATGDPETFDLSVAELEMHERRVRAFRVLLLFDAIFFVLLSITWLDALIAHEMGNLTNVIINGVVCVANILIDVLGLRAASIQSARWLGVFIALYWISLIGTIIAIPLLPLIPLLRFLLLPMAAAIKQFIEFQERQEQQLQHQAMIFV